jgi:ABC-type lipoprotein release transport system permease subunit
LLPAFSWSLAVKYLLSRRVSLLGVGGVALAVWALIVVIGVFSGFVSGIREDIRRSSPDLLLTTLPPNQSYEKLQPAVVATEGVADCSVRLRHYGVYYLREVPFPTLAQLADFRGDESQFVQLLGIDPDHEGKITPIREWIERVKGNEWRPLDPDRPLHVADELEREGRERHHLPVPPPSEPYHAQWPGILLGASRGRTLPFRGDPVDVVTAEFASGKADGVLSLQKTFCMVGAFDTHHRLFDEGTALVPVEALRTMLGHDIADADSIDICTDVAIKLAPGADPEATARRIRTAVLPLLPAGSNPEVLTWQEQNTVFLDAVEHERALMKLVLFAVMLVAAFLIHATLHMMVSTKVKDVGIVLALGGAPRAIGAIFLLAGLVVGVLGCLFGLGIGLLSVVYLNPVNDWMMATFGVEIFPRTLYDLPEVPTRLEAGWIAVVLTSALVLALLAAWRPARKAARLQPVAALAYE